MKRIINCSDGTWNKPNMTYDNQVVRTNVQLIFECISKSANGVMQIKHYDEGVGCEGNWCTRMVGAATGDGIDANILSGYKFISWNYEPGDEIYLFGFSRGAYTARSLAGLIRKCGVLKTYDLNVFQNAYDLYRDKSVSPTNQKAVDFRAKNSFCPDVNIKFIGVWDTVGALGIPINGFQWYNKKKYSFYDTTLSSYVDYAYHAVAVDEMRKNFAPTLWTLSRNDDGTPANPNQVLEQRWFSGSHSNIGGGFKDRGLSDLTLGWMIEKAQATGLGFDGNPCAALKGNALGEYFMSKTGIFSLLPDFIRDIKKDSTVDPTVLQRKKDMASYDPKNKDYFNQTK